MAWLSTKLKGYSFKLPYDFLAGSLPPIMKRQLYIILIFLATSAVGQTLDKGIYKGQKLPFTICYLTYSDSIIEVEYFSQKGGQIFFHTEAKKLEWGLESFATKPIFKSSDDSILVFSKKDYFLIKRKKQDRVKVYKSNETQDDISTLRKRYKLHKFYGDLNNERKTSSDIDETKFWNKVHSFKLENELGLKENEFDLKLDEVRMKIKNWW